jgi:hypothetical protein
MDENEHRVIGLSVPELSGRILEKKTPNNSVAVLYMLSIFESETFRIRRRVATRSRKMI